MNDPYLMSNYPKPPTREPQRPEGMQGPERHLVGESLRDSTKDAVEEAKLGRRDVGEIGGAVDLLGIIDRMLAQARWHEDRATRKNELSLADDFNTLRSELKDLREKFSDTVSQRSDLSNEPSPSVDATE